MFPLNHKYLSTAFPLRENLKHGTDGQTDGQTDVAATLYAALVAAP